MTGICHSKAPLESDSLHDTLWKFLDTVSVPAGPRFVPMRMACWYRIESVTDPLFCLLDSRVPVHRQVQPGRQLTSEGFRLLSDGHSLNSVPPGLCGACGRARRPACLLSLPRQLRANHPAPFQGSWSQLGHSAWGRSQAVLFSPSFLIPQ